MSQSNIQILQAQHLRDYQLELHFSDQSKRVVDFGPFLTHARNPQIKQFQEPKRFLDFRIEYGDLIWGDYDMCFPIWDLYTGKIIKKTVPESPS